MDVRCIVQPSLCFPVSRENRIESNRTERSKARNRFPRASCPEIRPHRSCATARAAPCKAQHKLAQMGRPLLAVTPRTAIGSGGSYCGRGELRTLIRIHRLWSLVAQQSRGSVNFPRRGCRGRGCCPLVLHRFCGQYHRWCCCCLPRGR